MNKDFDFSDFLLKFYSRSEWRRPKVILNNLIGRRTVSNLFWGMQYGLLPFFDLFPKLNNENFDHFQKKFKQDGFIEVQDKEVRLTDTGKLRKETNLSKNFQFQFKGIGLYTNIETIKDCLNLTVQIISEFAFKNNRYYPLQYSGRVMNFCKRWFRQNKSPELPNKFQQELSEFLKTLDNKSADAFVASFVGHNSFGLTDHQIKTDLSLNSFEWKIIDLALMTEFIWWASDDNSQTHPLCQNLVTPWLADSPLSMSSEVTYQLFLNNFSIEKIAQKRHIKVNTVREHLLEAAILIKDFPFQSFLSAPLPTNLHNYLQNNPVLQWQFSVVNELVPEFSFFEFRLLQIREDRTQK
ncbi:helix-turn-helix domain-containing protein [Pediococcus damnosus]|uniref:helix-turn-helix domain-containing protein n=1 Tax=Pediococcus damnosus TaxID=51663 RepID=UPI000C1FD289|nr:helix-turn-helix domain-containing protein [Pediococcus damnosus]PJE48543.1 hypothetical protein BSQ36_00480 [Pediococcus damnosus]